MRMRFTKTENINSGLALLILILLLKIIFHVYFADFLLLILVFLVIAAPNLFYPFSILWYNLSDVLGNIISKIILSIIYIAFVLPVGAIRKMMGNDSLMLKKFKKNKVSVFKVRQYTFTKKDLLNPF